MIWYSLTERAREFYAQTYDVSVSDWSGEIDFYRELAAEANSNGRAVLEVACGTGRVAMRLARDGVEVVGLDYSSTMLDVAREKSAGMSNIRWVQGDMRSFELGEAFGLVIIPGQAFHNMLTVADQIACLKSIRRHLVPGGVLVVHLDHQNVSWLGDLRRGAREGSSKRQSSSPIRRRGDWYVLHEPGLTNPRPRRLLLRRFGRKSTQTGRSQTAGKADRSDFTACFASRWSICWL